MYIIYTEKLLRLFLLTGLFVYYPGTLIYNFIVGCIALTISGVDMLNFLPGLNNLILIESIATPVLVLTSIISGWLLLKNNKHTKAFIFSFLLLTLIYYLLEPMLLQIAGLPAEPYETQLYEKPSGLLRPVAAAIIFIIYFKIRSISEYTVLR